MERMRRLRAELSERDSPRRYTGEYGVHVFFGQASFVDGTHLRVGDQVLEFSKCCIATGIYIYFLALRTTKSVLHF